jgi:hypothetical protein
MLMHFDYHTSLRDHDSTVAPRHQLTASVYTTYLLSVHRAFDYLDPTYIAVCSTKHEQSNGESHASDFCLFC